MATVGFGTDGPIGSSLLQSYEEFVRQTLGKHPRLRATRIFEMVRSPGYQGGIAQLRRLVRRLRARPKELYARVQVFPAEQAQVEWGHFGLVRVGRASRQRPSGISVREHRVARRNPLLA